MIDNKRGRASSGGEGRRDLAKHPLGEGAKVGHHQLEHLIVGSPREEDLACEDLVDDTAYTPHVQCVA